MPESQTAETPNNEPAETPEPTANELDQVVALLNGDESKSDDQEKVDQGDDSTESESQSETAENGKPKDLAAVAEALGIEVKDLYEMGVPFDLGNGEAETRTLGEIKDAISKQVTFEVDQLAWEETKAEREAELLRANAELQELVAMLPKQALNQELLQRVAQKRHDTVEREQRLTRSAIPEWTNDDVEQSDRNEMREHLATYGFPSNYLDQVVDHRTIAFIRDATKRAARIKSALAQVKTVRKPGHAPSGKPSKPAQRQKSARNTRNVTSQVSQIAELLNG